MSTLKRVIETAKTISKIVTGNGQHELNQEFLSCCKRRDLAGVDRAIRNGADINDKNVEGKPALIIASSIDKASGIVPDNSFDLVMLLLRLGGCGREHEPHVSRTQIIVDARDNLGNTALIMAARNGNKRIVEALIEAGANVNARNNEGCTGLMRAEKHGYDDTAAALREHGARE